MRTHRSSLFHICFVVTCAHLSWLALCPLQAGEEAKQEPPAKKVWQQLRPERVVSENTFVYLATPDVSKARAAFERTAFKGLLDEDDILVPVTAALGKLRETYVKGDGTRSEAEVHRRNEEVDLLLKVAPLLDGQVALAFDADPAGLGGLVRGKLPRFLLAAVMPSGDAGAERQLQLEQAMERYRTALATDVRYVDFDTALGSYALHGLENKDQGTFEAWAFVENLFLYGQGKGMVEDAVTRFTQGNGAGALALNAGYQSVYSKVGRDEHGEALLYIQVDAVPLLSGGGASPWQQFLGRLLPGVAAMQANRPQFALGIQVGAGENAPVREKLMIRTSPELLPKGRDYCKGESARFASSDTLFYTAVENNLAAWLASYKDLLLSAGGREAALAQQRLNALLDVKTADEIPAKLALFKGEIAALLDYAPKPGAPLATWTDCLSGFQLVLALELDRENAAAEQTLTSMLARIETGTGQQYVRTSIGDTVIHYQRGSAPGEERAGSGALGLWANLGAADLKGTPFFVAYARVDLEAAGGAPARKFLLLSDDLNALKKAVAQKNAPHTSLTSSAAFKGLMKSFKESRYEMTYFNLDKALVIYKTLLPMLGKSGLVGREFINQLPNASALEAHLFPMGWAKSAMSEPDGILVECASPTGNLPLVGLLGSLAWPAYNATQQKAVSAEVDTQFKRILLGLHLYAADFDRFPAQLSDLVPVYIGEQEWKAVFESPFNRGALNVPADVNNPELTNLVYLPNKTMYDLGRDIVLYEKDPTRLSGSDTVKLLHHVLTVDGRIKGLPQVALDRALAGKAEIVNTDLKGAPAVAPR